MIAPNEQIAGSANEQKEQPIKRQRGQHREGCDCNICQSRAKAMANPANPREVKPMDSGEPRRPKTMSEAPDIIKATAHAEKTVQAKLAELAADKGQPAPIVQSEPVQDAPIPPPSQPFKIGAICKDALEELERFWNE